MDKKKFDLSGKLAIVTGSGSGIGRAISIALGVGGAKVAILDLNEDQAIAVAGEVADLGGVAIAKACDVSDSDQVAQAFNEICGDQPLNILVNNAGIAHIGNVSNTSPEDLDKLYQVNIKGVYNGLRSGVEKMTNGGAIVNLSSIAAHVGLKDRFAYSMTKGAVHAMTLSVAKDYIENKIRCNSITPARVHTPFVDNFLKNNYPGKETEMFDVLSKTQPIGRMGTPAEVGDLVLYLCTDEASFITGSSFSIDGGFTTLNN